MSVKYIEEYMILGTSYGIEDHDDGRDASDHFFHDDFLSGKSRRFQVWVGGCGTGKFHSYEEAKKYLIDYALARTTEKRDKAMNHITECDYVINALSPKQDPLFKFRIKE